MSAGKVMDHPQVARAVEFALALSKSATEADLTELQAMVAFGVVMATGFKQRPPNNEITKGLADALDAWIMHAMMALLLVDEKRPDVPAAAPAVEGGPA